LKFSVLIPTRNRLEYLKLAVESVRRQDFADWEIVISDNCSEQDIGGYVSSLADPRIVYARTEQSLPVTENWNRALAMSSGEYVVMLGDDDALLQGYFNSASKLIVEFNEPDLIYTKAVLFTYPGVDPARPEGFANEHGCAEFFVGADAPFVLDHERALAVVQAAMRFRLRYDFNAQFALISRRLIGEVQRHGDFYQSDFPDYYSMNAAFLKADTIIVDPDPRVLIGVTPKSYGFYHVNSKEGEGRDFLAGGTAAPSTGTNINVGWLSAMSTLEHRFGREFGMKVDRRRYRLVQAAYVHERFRMGLLGIEDVRRLERELPLLERWAYRLVGASIRLMYRILPESVRRRTTQLAHRTVGQIPAVYPASLEGRFANALEVCEAQGAKASAGRVPVASRE
jgi:glycosyltransferase involved in cell wall biosynthesis